MAVPLSAEERFAIGQQRRKQIRRTQHAVWKPKERRENPLKLLQRSMHGRIPALVALKYERMEASPFGYFRGAVPVMAYDLSLIGNTGICSQLCGDAHVRNLGAYAAPDGRIVFDINDFDETISSPFEWDVKRMAVSLILAGREAGASDKNCREATTVFLKQYRRLMADFARMPVLEVARFQVHRLQKIPAVEKILEMAGKTAAKETVRELTTANKKWGSERQHQTTAHANKSVTPGRTFKTIPPDLKRLIGVEAGRVTDSLTKYAESLSPERRIFFLQYKTVDVAFKVVGTGSVGLRDYCIYMVGNGPKDPMFLQIKEEVQSGYAPYLQRQRSKANRPSAFHQGRRVVEGARRMQLQSDPFLGWTTMGGRDYLVRQLNDNKASVQLKDLNQAGLVEYACVCGELLARGHARSGDSSMLAGYLGVSGTFADAVTSFAEAYADQTERDWKELVRSRKRR